MFKVTTLVKAIETAKTVKEVGIYNDSFFDLPEALRESYEFMYDAVVEFCEDGYEHGKDWAKEINKEVEFNY